MKFSLDISEKELNYQKNAKMPLLSNGTELITQLIFLFAVPCSLSQQVNLILSDYLRNIFEQSKSKP